jgi:predicted PurR-regulated permease PerM
MARGHAAIHVLAAFLAGAAALVFVPLWAPLVLAAWIADLMRPMARRLERALGGRRAAAGALGVLVVLALGLPVAVAVVMLASRLGDVVTAASSEGTPERALRDMLGRTGEAAATPTLGAVLREHGAAAWRVLGGVWSVSVSVVVGVAVFVVTLYALSVRGPEWYAWLARRVPLEPTARKRLVGAFRETGRGLIVGMGGTALVQGTLAAVVYAALGIDNFVVLGMLTGVGALVPTVGTAIVWAPVAVALALSGHPVRAVVLGVVGVGVISTVDNVIRPWLARAGHLHLPAVLVFLSMLGGLRLIGGWGVLLGPLLVRMGVEALSLERDRIYRPR